MPTIPTDQNRVSPSGLPGARSTVNYSPDAFGASTGRALMSLAGDIGDIAQAEQQKQDTAVLMGAERELQDWENKALFTPQTGAYAQRGRDSFGLLEKTMPDYDKVYGSIESRLNNRQREVFRQRTMDKRSGIERGLMRHIGQEAEQFQKSETNALVATRLDTAMLYANDPERFDRELREAQNTFMAGNAELPPAALAVGVKTIESKGRQQVVQKMLLDGYALGAKRYFDRYRDVFTADDAGQMERLLGPSVDQALGEDVGRRLLAGQSITGNWTPTDDRSGAIKAAADELGIDAVDLATVISYETGGTFDPDQKGPTTKWGQHKGLIQFGEPQRAKYGVRDGMSFAEQMRSVVAYLKDAGVKPGMGIMDVYSAINAGAPGRYNASDAAAGGAPGTVADKVTGQMGAHRAKAQAMFTAGAGGAGGGMASPESAAAAIPQPRTYADAINAARNIPNENVRRAAMNWIEQQDAVEKRREAEQKQAVVQSANTKVEQADPALPLAKIVSPDELAQLQRYGMVDQYEARLKQRAAGVAPTTDWSAYYRARNMAITNPQEFSTVDVYSLRTKMADTEFKELVKLQEDIKAGKGEKATEGFRTVKQVVDGSLRLAGLDPSPKEGSEQAKRIEAFNRSLDDQVKVFKTTHGKEPTPDDVQKMADGLLIRGELDGSGWLSDKKVFAFERTGGNDNFIPEELPQADRDRVTKEIKGSRSFKASGAAEPSERQIIDTWVYMKRNGML